LVIATHGRGIWIVDDIAPLRALTPEMLGKEAVFLQGRPAAQQLQAGGGWAGGDAEFSGPNPTDEAVVTYYQKKRHIFGDLKIEVFDQQGQSLGVIPSSKRRGLNRATWGMRLKPPKVPTAASISGSAFTGPRLLPGTYTVKMTKDKQVYTTELRVVADPRATHTAQDRKAEFDLAVKLYNLLGEMTYTVDRINGLRLALEDRAAKLPAGDPVGKQLEAASARLDDLRKKIVATKEGGMITGEERLRENLTDLYGGVVGYEGRPSQTQLQRADAIARELDDVTRGFDTWAARELAGLNSAVAGKGLEPLKLMTRNEWDSKSSGK
jgi:hypothetical protein